MTFEILPDLILRVDFESHNRRLPPDMKQWLGDNVGPLLEEGAPNILAEGDGWYATIYRPGIPCPQMVRFRFYNRNHALMFKLRWGGDLAD